MLDVREALPANWSANGTLGLGRGLARGWLGSPWVADLQQRGVAVVRQQVMSALGHCPGAVPRVSVGQRSGPTLDKHEAKLGGSLFHCANLAGLFYQPKLGACMTQRLVCCSRVVVGLPSSAAALTGKGVGRCRPR